MAKGVVIKLNTIIPKPVDVEKLKSDLNHAVRVTTKYIQKDMGYVTGTWEHKPDFTDGHPHVVKGNLVGTVVTHQNIYRWLDDGTAEKWIILNYPYEDKTHTDSIYSTAGVRTIDLMGNYWSIKGRQNMMNAGFGPQKGIDKREFSLKIAKRAFPVLLAAVNRALDLSGF